MVLGSSERYLQSTPWRLLANISCCRLTQSPVLLVEPALGCCNVECRCVWDSAGSWRSSLSLYLFSLVLLSPLSTSWSTVMFSEEAPILGRKD